MTDKKTLAEIAQGLELVSPQTSRTLVQDILSGKPGIFPVSGQMGSGKLLTTLMLAYQIWQQGNPVILFSEDPNLIEEVHFTLPSNWEFKALENIETHWLEAIEQVIHTSTNTVIVIDQLSYYNKNAALKASKAGHWVFTSIDIPFIGMDVLSHLSTWQYSHQDILEQVSGIVSQMLLPRLCESCRVKRQGSLEETRLIYPDSLVARELWFEEGCPDCSVDSPEHFRYGRCASYEVIKVDEQTRSLLEDYLNNKFLSPLPTSHHFTMQEGTRGLVKDGLVSIQTYQQKVLQNPLLRIQHLWEQENLRAAHIQQIFGRFVTKHLVNELISYHNYERVIEGEKRDITCFFCDIRGFTTWSEENSPADIFTTLNKYFREMIDVVFEYEGTIDKFIGDSLMVIFGAPTEQVDHYHRAVRCAIAIQKKVATINESSDNAPLSIGIGINTGEVVAGCLGSERRMDYTVLGDVVNIAARLESKAGAGQILISYDTFLVVQNSVHCQSVGNLSLKGKSQMLEAFEVLYS